MSLRILRACATDGAIDEGVSELPSPATRRDVLILGAGAAGSILLTRPSAATPEQMREAILELTNGAPIRPGKVHIDVPPLVENGNSVPITVSVDSPMTADAHVTLIALFNEKNPQPNVGTFRMGPRSGKARVATRIRLATSQQLTAIARLNDGSFWSDKVDVIVTIAACTEDS
ncbi:MAG: SoxY-related AACIE arm protein [Beijerinckiaceae bacterium]|nr:SoxY-related AACIE arm protein [Beijerinckiaceae bacterium]